MSRGQNCTPACKHWKRSETMQHWATFITPELVLNVLWVVYSRSHSGFLVQVYVFHQHTQFSSLIIVIQILGPFELYSSRYDQSNWSFWHHEISVIKSRFEVMDCNLTSLIVSPITYLRLIMCRMSQKWRKLVVWCSVAGSQGLAGDAELPSEVIPGGQLIRIQLSATLILSLEWILGRVVYG